MSNTPQAPFTLDMSFRFGGGPQRSKVTVQEDQKPSLEAQWATLMLDLRSRKNIIGRARLTAKAKTLYATMFPSTQPGNPGISKQKGKGRKVAVLESFAARVARETLCSQRSVNLDVQIATMLTSETLDFLEGTKVSSATRTLARLCNLDSNQQAEILGVYQKAGYKAFWTALGDLAPLVPAKPPFETSQAIRDLLLALPNAESRKEALSQVAVCFACGEDREGKSRRCPCTNDE